MFIPIEIPVLVVSGIIAFGLVLLTLTKPKRRTTRIIRTTRIVTMYRVRPKE
jgi:hypothetical protein